MPGDTKRRNFFAFTALLVFLCAPAGCSGSSGSSGTEKRQVFAEPVIFGAHYHLWYPSNFAQGYLRSSLQPPQEPVLGEYNSASRSVIEQHISWASAAGISFFTLDYWPTRSGFRPAIEHFLGAGNIDRIKFAVFYELWDLGFDGPTLATVVSPERSALLRDDFQYFAERLFSHPSYLQHEGRPVVFIYLSRTLVGDYRGVIETIRKTAADAGIELYLIGDEIYWHVTREENGSNIHTSAPHVERAGLFDALFMYNPYAPALTSQAGYGAESTLLSDIEGLYQRYRTALPGMPLVPMVMPGYNDRGVRPVLENKVIPRRWSRDAAGGSFFEEMLYRFSLPNVDPALPYVLITSWNEWNEDTAIEPVHGSGATDQPSRLTEGYVYEPYGELYLQVLSSNAAQ